MARTGTALRPRSLMAMYWDGMGCHGMPLPPHAAPKQIRAFWQCPEDNGSPTSSASPATGGKSEPLFAQRFWLAAHHKDQDRGNGSLPPLDVSARRLEIARFADTYMHTCIRTWEASRLEVHTTSYFLETASRGFGVSLLCCAEMEPHDNLD